MRHLLHFAVTACVAVLASGCARTLFGRGTPFQPFATPAIGVTVEDRDGLLVVHPLEDATARPLLFLHGFAARPEGYRFTLEQLAARGFVVYAPTLPDYFLGRIGYHRSVVEAAEAAWGLARSERHADPVVVGHSMGGGAALHVAAAHRVAAVLWAPVALDLEQPRPSAPVLVLIADHDCIAKEKPEALVTALHGAAERALMPGNHLGFTDLSGGEQYDCPSPVSRDVQRLDAIERSVAFLSAKPP
jgi:hypothetical protein